MEMKIQSSDDLEEMAIILLMSALGRRIVLQPKEGLDFDAITRMAKEVWAEQESGLLGFPQHWPSHHAKDFPTPRSWALRGKMLEGTELESLLGEGAAAELRAFTNVSNQLVNPPCAHCGGLGGATGAGGADGHDGPCHSGPFTTEAK